MSLPVAADDGKQFFSRSGTGCIGQTRLRDMLSNVAFDEFLHQPANGSAHRCDQLQGRRAIGIVQQLSLNGGNLSGYAANTPQQLIAINYMMSHRIPPYTILALCKRRHFHCRAPPALPPPCVSR